MTAAYDASPRNFVVGVVFYGPSTNLTTPSAAGGSPADLYRYTIVANHTSYSNSEYLNSRFATAQVKAYVFVSYRLASPLFENERVS